MKRLMNMTVRPLIALFLSSILFTACKKIGNDENMPAPAAGLMAFNLAPDKAAVGFTLSGNNFGNAPLAYTNYSGVYFPVFTGDREVRSFDYNTGNTLATTTNNFADSGFYSAFLLGANGNYRNVVVKDELDSLKNATGKAWVRYVNAVVDSVSSPTVTIGEGTFNEAAPYASVSAFKQVSAGALNTAISNGSNISASRTITVDENKVYTVLFVGQPNQADSTKAVQVKFIINGIITP